MSNKNEIELARAALADADAAGMVLVRENDRLRAEIEQLKLITDWADIDALRAKIERHERRFREAEAEWVDRFQDLEAKNERLRARLCYVNPDGSHVRGCAQHEAQHPAQWCESLAGP